MRSKVKTPLEHFVSALRAVRGRTDGITQVFNYLSPLAAPAVSESGADRLAGGRRRLDRHEQHARAAELRHPRGELLAGPTSARTRSHCSTRTASPRHRATRRDRGLPRSTRSFGGARHAGRTQRGARFPRHRRLRQPARATTTRASANWPASCSATRSSRNSRRSRRCSIASTCSCSRRSFLRGCGLTLTGFGIASVFPTPFIQHALAGDARTSTKRLLFIFLRGGNDGINAVIPHGDPDYSIDQPADAVHPVQRAVRSLNGFASLHPSLGNLLEAYNAGDLARRAPRRLSEQLALALRRPAHLGERRSRRSRSCSRAGCYRYIQESALVRGRAGCRCCRCSRTPPLLLRGDEKFVNIANPDSFTTTPPSPSARSSRAHWRELYANLHRARSRTGRSCRRPA